jgi:hypothetical protein
MLAAVTQNGLALQYADESLKNDREIILTAVNKNNLVLLELPKEFEPDYKDINSYKKIALSLINNKSQEIFVNFPDFLKKDKNVTMAAVSKTGWLIRRTDESLKKDFETILMVCKNINADLSELIDLDNFVKFTLDQQKQIILALIKRSPQNIMHVDRLLNDRNFLINTVKLNVLVLKFVDESFNLGDDREVILEAVKQNGLALRFASDALRNDRGVILEAVKQNGREVLQYAHKLLNNDEEILTAAVKQNIESKSAKMLPLFRERLKNNSKTDIEFNFSDDNTPTEKETTNKKNHSESRNR